MGIGLVMVLLAAAPGPKAASMGFRAIGVDAQKVDFFAARFALELQGATGMPVVTPEEMSAVIGLERQRALLGCPEESSCLAELAGGLGADVLVLGTIARVGESWALTVKLVNAKDGKVVAARSGQVAREDEVLGWLSETARQTGAAVRERYEVSSGAGTPRRSGFSRRVALIPAVGAGVLAVAGGVLLGVAHGSVSAVAAGDGSISDTPTLDARLQGATSLQTAWAVMVAWRGSVARRGWRRRTACCWWASPAPARSGTTRRRPCVCSISRARRSPPSPGARDTSASRARGLASRS